MAKRISNKKRVVTSIHNLPEDIQEMVAEHYPTGYSEAMMRIDKPNGDFFYAVPFQTDEIDYLVKIDVKIDDKNQNDNDADDDKDLFEENLDAKDDLLNEVEDDDDSDDM